MGDEAQNELARLLRLEVRIDELRDLLQSRWSESTDRGKALKDIALLDIEPIPIEGVKTVLEQARALSPEDLGVGLGLANLAIRAGRLEEARELLEVSLARQPNDPVLWRSWLDWSLAAEQPGEILAALRRLTDHAIDPSRRLALRAWFFRQRGLQDRERVALNDWLAWDPANLEALERLALAAHREGQDKELAELRQRKAHVNEIREQYFDLLMRDDRETHSSTLARMADELGRRFEARAWATLAVERDTDDLDSRDLLDRSDKSVPKAPSVSDLLREQEAMGAFTSRTRASGVLAPIPSFVEQGESAGLRFSYESGRSWKHQLPETMGGGVALLDFDSDGWLDVFVVQGGVFPPSGDESSGGDRLFRNRRNGQFEDVTESAGLAGHRGYGHGATVGDYDNDGFPDLFVTRWRGYGLYHNRGDGTFEDVTGAAGLGGDRDWPTSAAFADLDQDGDLDLYVCHYLKWDESNPVLCANPYRNALTACEPHRFPAQSDRVFRNDSGRFIDVTEQSGLHDQEGRGLGVVASDLDGDGLVDLFVANDTTANFLLRNLGGFRFEEVALASGVAANAAGGYQAGMGVALGDLNHDGWPDLAVTNYYGESTTFYGSLGQGLFSDQSAAIGLVAPSRYKLGFGACFADLNNDGNLDLMTANGHVDDLSPVFPFRMPAQVFLGDREGRVHDVRDQCGEAFRTARLGRGLAVGDLDNDGWIDAILVDQDGPLALLRNRTEAKGHWLTLRLEGRTSNRDAIGAAVTVTTRDARLVAWRHGGGSYQSSSDLRLHFGLGKAERIASVEVRWPSGIRSEYHHIGVDRAYHLREGESSPQPLAGFVAAP